MKTLTILIPNYNRATSLHFLLGSVYASISNSRAEERVEVLVVDDFSEEDLTESIQPYHTYSNFTFVSQRAKCGNAEVAFLSALDHVTTPYVWLVGNDDYLYIEAVSCVLRVIDTCRPGFVLLNPRIRKIAVDREFMPIHTTAPTVMYERCEDLFLDFGFVTSTTTFTCLIMKTEPVRAFHRKYRLTDVARVYAHTFTIYGALRTERAIFVSSPIVGFTLNERFDEYRKLLKQAPAGIQFYHQSLGLARLIRRCAETTGREIGMIGAACEDEINKDTMQVISTYLSHFLVFFFVEQLCREQSNVLRPVPEFGHLVRSEIEEVVHIIRGFNDPALWAMFSEALDVFELQSVGPGRKIAFLRSAHVELRQLSRNRYRQMSYVSASSGPRKVATSDLTTVLLRGTDGGRYGVR